MADIALRNYYRQIDQLIDQKHLEEALAYCKNILHHFPKDLEAYRLMGKALLERGRHGDAADVFQRVLSAMPDDFISHVGMAIVREDEGNLEAALWHMERAFEASPSNPAVQDELRRLYGRRDGIVPHRAQLTRGALARLYYKQGLYAQAETELRAGLAEQPERPDLMTLLVQVLWESGHRSEAISLGGGMLQRLPYNLEVNRVMAQAAASQNQAAEARECRQRLEELDPYEAFASESQSAASVQAEAIRLTEIAWSPELSDSPRPDWTNALGADLQPRNEEVLPDWVRSGTALLVDDSPTNPSVAGPTPDLPDWMRATTGMLGGAPATTPEPEAAAPEATPAFEMEPEPLPPFEPAAATDDFLPDWLADMTTPSAGEAATGSDQDWLTALSEPTRAEAPATSAPDTLPDWLHGVGTDGIGSDAVGSDAVGSDAVGSDAVGSDGNAPAWTPPITPGSFDAPLSAAALGAAGAGALSNLPEAQPSPASGSLDDLPDWLQSAATTGDSDVPDWLTTAQVASTEKALEPANDLPDWLPGESSELRNDSVLSSDTPDWLRSATGQTGILGAGPGVPSQPPAAEPPQSVTPDPADSDDDVVAANDLPAWLKAAQPADEFPQTPELAVPDWLDAASADTGDLGDLPDWLKASEPNVQNVTLPAATVEEPPIQEATVDVRAIEPPSIEPVKGIDLPDWLATAAEAPTSEGSSFDEDAFAWLENLAARQGADPAELTTPPADNPSPVESTEQVPSPDAAAESLPDWLKIPLDEQTPATPPASPLAEGASDDDAFAWLESLAARQGADPSELTTPTSEVELPDFLQPASAEAIERANAPVDWSEEDNAPLDTALSKDAEPDTGAMPEWIKALAPNEDAPAAQPLEMLPDVDPNELPDWLRPTAAMTSPTEQSAATPETMSDDDSFAWLEGLAAGQGAEPATLTGETGTELLETTPPLSDDDGFAWLEGLAAAQGADPNTLTTGPSDLPTGVIAPSDAAPVELADGDIDLPDWLASALDTAPEARPAATPSTEPTPATPSDDDAFAWLESLAARQGAEPGTLTTVEETVSEPSQADLPDWLSNVEAPVETANTDRTATRPLTEPEAEPQGPAWLRTPLEAEPVADEGPEITLPDWLRDEIGAPMATSMLMPLEEPNRVEPSPESQSVDEPVAETSAHTPEPAAPIEAAASVTEAQEPAGPPITTPDKRTALLAGKLAERKRAREAEIQDRFDRQRAAREAAQREIEQKLANRRAGLAPEPMRSPSDLPTAPLAPIDTPVAASVPQVPEPVMSRNDAPRPRWRPRTAAAYADVAPDVLLARSRAQLAGGQEAEAMAMYTQLIKTGQHLEVVLADLHAHIGRGKATAVAYRALGDAQMKSGALQDALASYRAALERA